jgi:AcrR family transcriptional regulator
MIDRRKQRTRKLLQDALIDLILQKGYEAFTIKELTEHANVNHATFYLHFKNKDHLLDVALRNTYEALILELAEDPRCCIDSKGTMIRIFQHVAAHAEIYRVLLSVSGGVNSAVVQTRNHIASVVMRQLTVLAPQPVGQIPYEVMAQHTAGALLAVIGWWLEHDMPFSPEIMGDMSCQLSSPPLLMGIGLGFRINQ